jgi:CRISPR-associated protein Csh2
MQKRDFLFIYDNQYNTPNGDPFTGDQRYDEATEKVLVSDLRIKRFIRDRLLEIDQDAIFVAHNTINASNLLKEEKAKSKAKKGEAGDKDKGSMSGAEFRFREHLMAKGLLDTKDFKKEIKSIEELDQPVEEIFKEFLDVRLFGGLLTVKNNNITIDGAVQFKNLSSSLNRAEIKVFQNTTVFPSDVIRNERGSIGTGSVVPYSLMAIEGWLNENTAKQNKLSEQDIMKMKNALWTGVRDKNTRSKTSQRPIVFFEIMYKPFASNIYPNTVVYKKIHNLGSLLNIESEKDDLALRGSNDYRINYDKLWEAISDESVEQVRFFTEDRQLRSHLEGQSKLEFTDILIG